jgi:signal transduction histidine kinase/CheY-like chemotaxis protein
MLVPAAEGDLLSSADVAGILDLSDEQVAQLAGAGELATAALSVGGMRLFRRSDVDELAAERAGRGVKHHAVQFYESHEFLCDVVARFIGQGLRTGAGAVLLLTAAHKLSVRNQLEADGIDVATALATGRLLFLDAHESLDGFMRGGQVDDARFFALVAAVMERVSGTAGTRLRAYGEMVDLLWKEGLIEAALQLERLWDEVTRTRPLSLLCAYDMENFQVGGDSGPFDRICAAHTKVIPTERFRQSDVIDARYRAIAQLQQRARALASELPRRTRAEQLVREREEELRRQNESLEAALRAKDEFLAMLGHELRNPLAPILLAVDLLRQRHGEASECAVIERQVKHLVRLVDDLLDVARLVRGKVTLHKRVIELADVIARGIELAPVLDITRRADLALRVPAEGLPVEVDPERMAQVVSNVLTNAVKYSDPGSPIVVSASGSDGRVLLSVRDAGVGIAPELIDRVFELFVQEKQTVDRTGGGLGLGLAIVRNIVELHGGLVSAHSAGAGRGTELRVELPLCATLTSSSHSAARHGADAVPTARTMRRILLVDDNEDAACLLGQVLERMGHSVAIAHDGPSALELAARFDPDVALLDIGLPVIDGHQLGARLREQLPVLRLIAISGYGDRASRTRSLTAGFEAHLVKPIRSEDIEAVLGA